MRSENRKKLIQINTVCTGSTGTIMGDIQRAAKAEGYDTLSIYGRRKGYRDLPCKKFGDGISFWIHVAINTIFDLQGSGSYIHTRRLVKRLKVEEPDIIHIHNLHGYYLNLHVLFRYLTKEYNGRIVWTFHDCWPITGHCAYFTEVGCDKWKEGCSNCPQKAKYPISLIYDMSSYNYRKKKKLFSSLDRLTIICPSHWMYNIVKESFLGDKDIRIVRNGIDKSVFRRLEPLDVIEGRVVKNKKVILGVANIWEERKGLGTFKRIANKIGEEYIIVLVGVSRHQKKGLLHNMIGVERTADREQLARLYSSAYVFINPSKEESFSLVTAEAISCGAPVIVLDNSAVKELVNDNNGVVLHTPTLFEFIKAIERVPVNNRSVVGESKVESKYGMTQNILQIYEEICGKT